MCGLVSIHASSTSLDDHLEDLDAMLTEMQHRGPDGSGRHHVPGALVQGHVRLAIIDPVHGQQPMLTDDERYSLVFNGAIYNYVELRRHLEERGVRFRTTSDTEVLLKLLVADGVEAIPRLNGMFSFVFHDRLTNSWLAARDPFGVKPLYMARTTSETVFASEIKAILANRRFTGRLDVDALAEYVTFQLTLGTRTLFEGIECIPPATWLQGEGHRVVRQYRYWKPNQVIELDDERQAADMVRSVLDDSMRLQLRADVPVGGYLSGGLDSSAVCAMTAHHLAQAIPVFHGRFDEGPSYDESHHAREVADFVGSDLHVVTLTPEDLVTSLPEIIRLLDEPVAGPGSFPQYVVSRLASRHVKVVLGGQGGDEIFGGYARYLIAYLEQALKGAITETQEEGQHIVTLDNVIPQLRVLKEYFPLMRQFWSSGLFDPMDRRYFALVDRSNGVLDLLHPDIRAELRPEAVFERYAEIFNGSDTKSYINKMLAFDMETLLPGLLHVEDRMSMGASIESRVPLLDTRLVDLLGSVTPRIKFQAGVGKHLLKLAVDGIVPSTVVDRGDKMGFPVPLVEWMARPEISSFVHDVVTGSSSSTPLIDVSAAKKRLSAGEYSNRQLWGVLSLQLWNRTFLDG